MNDDGSGIWSIVYNDETFYVTDGKKEESDGAWINIQKQAPLLILQENNLSVRVILNVAAGSFSIVYSKSDEIVAEKLVNIK